MSDRYDQLEKAKRLYDSGLLTKEEYEAEKALILRSSSVRGYTGPRFWGTSENTFCMLLHLSQLLGVVLPFIPFIGLVVPVVMWVSEKDKSPRVDAHGRVVLNWALSYIIYFAISLVLLLVLIGGLLLAAVVVLNIVFAIVGGVKASTGEVWKYPLSIPFFTVPDLAVQDAASDVKVTEVEVTEVIEPEPTGPHDKHNDNNNPPTAG